MPLFRYKTGDYGILKKQCDCDQFKTPVINLLGRGTDKIHFENKIIFPIQIENIIFQFDEIASDYQIIKSQNEISLRLEWLDRNYNEQEVSSVKNHIQLEVFNQLGLKLKNIQIYEAGQLYNKLGIAKSKAGTLIHLDNLSNQNGLKTELDINFSCFNEL